MLQWFSIIFIVLTIGAASIIHVYWSLGGTRFLDVAIPTRPEDNSRLFTPSSTATAAIAGALTGAVLIACYVHLTPQVQIVALPLRLVLGGLGLAFLARSIGDFRFVGFNKRKRGTPFSYWDDRFFSPVICANGASFLILAFCA